MKEHTIVEVSAEDVRKALADVLKEKYGKDVRILQTQTSGGSFFGSIYAWLS